MYHTYVLVKNGKAVYIGQTGNPKKRKTEHKRTKDFDNFVILQSYKTKSESLIAERILINFLTLFGDGEWYNKEDILLSIKRETSLRYK